MRTKDQRYSPAETTEQKSVIDATEWMRLPIPVFSIPNGAMLRNVYFSKKQNRQITYNPFAMAQKLKSEGLRTGVPDLMLAVARDGYHGLFIEMKKRDGGVLSDDQEKWMVWLTEQGYLVRVAAGSDEAIAIIKEYLAKPKSVFVPFLTHLEK